MRFEPQGIGNADVEAEAFAETIMTTIRALRQTASLLAHGERTVSIVYEIADLSHSSPATAVFRARVATSDMPLLERTQEHFVESIEQIKSGRLPEHLDYPTLQTYKRLGAIAERGRFVNHVQTDGRRADVSVVLKTRLDLELQKDRIVHGSISGKLKAYSTQGRNLIRVFPRTAPPVTCEFRDQDQSKVARLIEKEVVVVGRMRYRPNAYYPYFMRIEGVEPFKQPSEGLMLPRLRAESSQPVDGEASENWIRKLRRAW
jgi:hypothetical protein